MRLSPKYPVYVISKGRYDNCITADFLIKDNVKFTLLVEHTEYKQYKKHYPRVNILVLDPKVSGSGCSIPARNFVWEHSIKKGYNRHWILDDNIRCAQMRYKGDRIDSNAYINFTACEHFVDRYENIGIAGMNYSMFVANGCSLPPYYLNVHVYSCLLIDNNLPFRWRGRYNEDTDLCLQNLAHGKCTVLFNAFMMDKNRTMHNKGGNQSIYKADGRLKMSRSLERLWPKVVSTKRRFNRPQHHIKGNWRHFDTPLKKKEGIEIKPYSIQFALKQVKNIKSSVIKSYIEEYNGVKNGKTNEDK